MNLWTPWTLVTSTSLFVWGAIFWFRICSWKLGSLRYIPGTSRTLSIEHQRKGKHNNQFFSAWSTRDIKSTWDWAQEEATRLSWRLLSREWSLHRKSTQSFGISVTWDSKIPIVPKFGLQPVHAHRQHATQILHRACQQTRFGPWSEKVLQVETDKLVRERQPLCLDTNPVVCETWRWPSYRGGNLARSTEGSFAITSYEHQLAIWLGITSKESKTSIHPAGGQRHTSLRTIPESSWSLENLFRLRVKHKVSLRDSQDASVFRWRPYTVLYAQTSWSQYLGVL